jgi:hypothetical protein
VYPKVLEKAKDWVRAEIDIESLESRLKEESN